MFKHTLDNFNHAIAIHATCAISDGFNSASDDPVSSWWRITFDGLSPVVLAINPPCTKQHIMALNQGAVLYEPIPEPFSIEVLSND